MISSCEDTLDRNIVARPIATMQGVDAAEVLGVEENQELETEEEVKEYDPEDYDEFQRRMERNNILPGSDVWRLLWKEKAET